ncbi:MAG: NAD-dependent epimerase/dehydratase family protein [Bacteroidetes bacterium]|nr:NAD-dependent epimerase/dehydratase family protein [Bacteroidota bacterium]
MKSILLTGGSGFIGRNIRESYLAKKYNIIAPSHGELDIINEKSVESFFRAHPIDFVIHAAVKPGHRNAKDPTNLFYSNTRMFFNLERMKNFYEKMLVIGSGAIYDTRLPLYKITEDQFLHHIPEDEHGFCKYVSGKIIEKSESLYDLRVFGIFGKYEDYTIRFISNMICKALFNLPLTIKQDRTFDYLYINDLMAILDFFIENEIEEKSFNVSPDKSYSLVHIAHLILTVMGKDLPVIVAEEGNGLEYSGDNTRLTAVMKNIVFTDIKYAIRELFVWYDSNKESINVESLKVDK